MSMYFRPRFIVLKSKRTTTILLQEESLAAGDTLNTHKEGKTKKENIPHHTNFFKLLETTKCKTHKTQNKYSLEVNDDIPGRARGYL